MALFGGDMVQVTTPDGRTITVPSQLAAQFAGLIPASAPPAGGAVGLPSGGAPAWTPQDTAGLAAMTPPPKSVVPPASTGPVTFPGQPPASDTRAARGAVIDPTQLPVDGPDNTPAPMTNAQLAKIGNAGVYRTESDALDAKVAAAKRLGQIDADEATHVGQLAAIRDAESQRQLEANAKLANDLQSQLQAKQNEYTQNAKAIAGTKIDRTADHPILAAIGIALAGIGTAMKKESVNPALAAFYAAIDRKVAGQMQDLDKRRVGLSDQKDALGMQRQSNMDRLAKADQLRLGYLDQAQNQINTVKIMSQSDRSKANADMMTASIQEDKAKTLDSAMQREHAAIVAEQARKDALAMHRESLGVQYAGQAQSERHYQGDLAERKREFDIKEKNDKDEAVLKAGSTGNVQLAKDIKERAMGGEIADVQDKDGNVVGFRTGLITTRDGQIWIPNGTETSVSKLQDKHTAAVQLLQTIDEIRRLGPEWLSDTANSDKKRQLDQLFADAKLITKDQKGLGVIAGPDMDLIHGFLGTNDPTGFRNSLAGLDQARKSLVRDHNAELRARGLDKEWSPPDLGKRGAVELAGDSDLKSVLRNPNRDVTIDEWQREVGGNPAGSSRDPGTQRVRSYIAEHGNILPKDEAIIKAWGDALRGPNLDARRSAATYLQQAVKSGSPTVKALAQQMLTNSIDMPTIQAEALATPTGRSTSRIEVDKR